MVMSQLFSIFARILRQICYIGIILLFIPLAILYGIDFFVYILRLITFSTRWLSFRAVNPERNRQKSSLQKYVKKKDKMSKQVNAGIVFVLSNVRTKLSEYFLNSRHLNPNQGESISNKRCSEFPNKTGTKEHISMGKVNVIG
ncbi:hypothetical protein KAFR_0C06060 [Kazachstania africana CBS 2517]|uniref:Uncharacterized protein n=1 Tax=Kazachstania africana (strain ATCC 22294 / BCRC 22015 / CBS 2517 / CECT 1963 / NBRC 1671 / NRRL Y-8276) TaxID=1071382 RepID=H2AT97_KAZAF|nr:hypothetical protein KAFR_0C06060 [Kazachstania africana CBS 2517]CCF57597.1 hypothetical protein KAFR_0C06060 [Kazachstania africana CBS 2517]